MTMDRQEWREYLQPFVGQFVVIIDETDESKMISAGGRDVIGSRLEQRHHGVLTISLLNEDCLLTNDATILFAERVAKFAFGNSMATELSVSLLIRNIRKLNPQGNRWMIEESVARLPTSFLEEPELLANETFKRTIQTPPHKRRTITLKLGNEAVLKELSQSRYRLTSTIIPITLIELWQLAGRLQPLPTEILDPARMLHRLHDLMQIREYLLGELEGFKDLKEPAQLSALLGYTQRDSAARMRMVRPLIDDIIELLQMMRLDEHPLVLASKHRLDSAYGPLPEPTL